MIFGFELLETAGQAVLLKQDSPLHLKNQVYCRMWRQREREERVPREHIFFSVNADSHLGNSLLSNPGIDFCTWMRRHPAHNYACKIRPEKLMKQK